MHESTKSKQETYKEFSSRAKSTIEKFPVDIINKTTESFAEAAETCHRKKGWVHKVLVIVILFMKLEFIWVSWLLTLYSNMSPHVTVQVTIHFYVFHADYGGMQHVTTCHCLFLNKSILLFKKKRWHVLLHYFHLVFIGFFTVTWWWHAVTCFKK